MSGQKDAFVVPAGLVFRQEEGGLAIEHDGDIVLHGSLGHALQSVRSNQGNVELFLDAELKEVAAHRGTVKIHGSLKAESVHGKTIDVDGSVQAEGLYGGQIRVGGTPPAGNVNAMEAGVHIGGDALIREELCVRMAETSLWMVDWMPQQSSRTTVTYQSREMPKLDASKPVQMYRLAALARSAKSWRDNR